MNDKRPYFEKETYSAVISENCTGGMYTLGSVDSFKSFPLCNKTSDLFDYVCITNPNYCLVDGVKITHFFFIL